MQSPQSLHSRRCGKRSNAATLPKFRRISDSLRPARHDKPAGSKGLDAFTSLQLLRLVLAVKTDRVCRALLALLHLGQPGFLRSCSATLIVAENFLLQASHRYSYVGIASSLKNCTVPAYCNDTAAIVKQAPRHRVSQSCADLHGVSRARTTNRLTKGAQERYLSNTFRHDNRHEK